MSTVHASSAGRTSLRFREYRCLAAHRQRGKEIEASVKSREKAPSRRSAGVGVEEAAESSGTDDFMRGDRVLSRWWFIPSGWEMVSGGVRSFGVIPVFQFMVDVVQMFLGNNQESIKNFHLQGLDHPLDVCPQVG